MKLWKFAPIFFVVSSAAAQSIALPWTGHGHDPQHTAISKIASQPISTIRWQMPIDLTRIYWGTSLLAHYGSPLITRNNTVIVPIKDGADDGFHVEARAAADGAMKWTQSTDYTVPPHNWVPSYNVVLTPKNRLWFAGAAGSARFRDNPDAASGTTGQVFFYGQENYDADPATYNSTIKINTPITADRYGNIFFGFQVTGSNPIGLTSGIARIAEDGSGSWISATTAAADNNIVKVVHNCAPALSNDHKTLYLAVSQGDYDAGYLLALNSRTLAPVAKVRLFDPRSPGNLSLLPDDGTASPTVGPDGDVYFGVFANTGYGYNHYRGWMLHFDSTLTQLKTPGAFGWDDTASIVPAALVASYHGASSYLLLTKYNNYIGGGGDGVNKIAVLDPNASMIDPITGASVMKEVITITGPTHDGDYPDNPAAVREWCINTAAVDPFTKSALVSCEDGKLYRWDFGSNALTESLVLTDGLGEAYTPTTIGMDGTVYAIANGILFAIGAAAK